jgi:hypothetical protein
MIGPGPVGFYASMPHSVVSADACSGAHCVRFLMTCPIIPTGMSLLSVATSFKHPSSPNASLVLPHPPIYPLFLPRCLAQGRKYMWILDGLLAGKLVAFSPARCGGGIVITISRRKDTGFVIDINPTGERRGKSLVRTSSLSRMDKLPSYVSSALAPLALTTSLSYELPWMLCE